MKTHYSHSDVPYLDSPPPPPLSPSRETASPKNTRKKTKLGTTHSLHQGEKKEEEGATSQEEEQYSHLSRPGVDHTDFEYIRPSASTQKMLR